ncbi:MULTISPECIES: hypothetical protein [Lacticaseibacillus]|uniref:Uncharacterized protein n=2 Tax=Lacticaseibacillus TaxID=2759736 RepID=A0AAN1EZD1_LACCA|nr:MULTISPECIES: hypothetical protein [Lacticaseibacillus]ARY91940.1 hypothetical protein BGL52_09320 [Lacticaseibacillus casei]KAB1970987.1 hypothetical protein F9B82_00400 [Lacticaseibacillus casei]WLV79843.1 hypothetical protein LACSTY_001875 [Lacticaseibacillus sp. NCIMB 15473]WNX23803.1 hypothetical protein RWA15_09085 [Lacticaseibacillus casei]WNX26578.1 hypothetical protein RWA16_09090 [Lacticaseibacillus casei]
MRQIISFVASILFMFFLFPSFKHHPRPIWYWIWYLSLAIVCIGATGFGLWMLVVAKFRVKYSTSVLMGILMIALMPSALIRATLLFRAYRKRNSHQ